jgi:hypothetical protein
MEVGRPSAAGRRGDATGMKNPENICMARAAMTLWILRFAQNDSSPK